MVVIECDRCRKEGPAVSLTETPRGQQPVAEGAAQSRQGDLEGVGHIVQQGGQLGCHSPVSHHLHRVQTTPQDRAFLISLFSLFLSAAQMLQPQQATEDG
ncbi:hypothetical protein PBY51_005655 [Eleginops maclovinus]|uniref:Uncharacterized protein n=1 Tax=Eleginops maclovinus TaxID=56733 RepID=A0AAN7X6S8_ELEMC|nr:hypothetical protein PBY51_005655 [Eleginops maclovinus]